MELIRSHEYANLLIESAMKRNLFQKCALLLSALFLMVSCNKDDDPTPAPTPAPTEFKAMAEMVKYC